MREQRSSACAILKLPKNHISFRVFFFVTVSLLCGKMAVQVWLVCIEGNSGRRNVANSQVFAKIYYNLYKLPKHEF